MRITAFKLLSALAAPIGIITLSAAFVFRKEPAADSLYTVLKNSPYVLFLIGMALSCLFNRSRIFFILTVLLVSELGLSSFVPEGPDKNLYLSLVYPAVCFLVPTNITIFSFLKERGVLNVYGRNRLSFLLVQLILVAWIFWTEDRRLVNLINLKATSLTLFNLTPIPQIPIFVFLITFIILFVRLALSGSPLEGSFTGVLAAVAIALHFKGNSPASACFFSVSGLILIIAVIQDSYSKAYLDELTGLPARRSLKEEMMKLGGRYVIAMVDIDYFKTINDTYGHDVGDQVLKFLASMIKDVSGGGKPFRYGGEEFAIIFAGKGINETAPYLEELRAKISRRGFLLRGKGRTRKKPKQVKTVKNQAKKIFITVSIGASEKNERNKTPEEVIKAADAALYRAKEGGRNCVSL